MTEQGPAWPEGRRLLTRRPKRPALLRDTEAGADATDWWSATRRRARRERTAWLRTVLRRRERVVRDEGRGRPQMGTRAALSKGRPMAQPPHPLLGRRLRRDGAFRWFLPIVIACGVAQACAAAGPAGAPGGPEPAPTDAPALPPIPEVDGPLRLHIGYPPEGARLTASDSNFIFGATGTGRASLAINGTPVEVAPNGGFLAFLPVPPDGVYRLQATVDGRTAELTRTVRVPEPAPPSPSGAAILGSTVYPTGAIALPRGEAFELGFRGPAGGRAWLLTPAGWFPLVEERPASGGDAAAESFRTRPADANDPGRLATYRRSAIATLDWVADDTAVAKPRLRRHEGQWTAYAPFEPQPGESPLPEPRTPRDSLDQLRYRLGVIADSVTILADRLAASAERQATLQLMMDGDTATLPVPLNLAVLDRTDPQVGEAWPGGAAPPPADWTIRGRPWVSGPYHYFWPAGTRLHIDAERNGMFRVRLSETLAAWVPAADVRMLERGTPLPRSIVGSARFRPGDESVDLRVPLGERLPFHVTESERGLRIEVFGATSQLNFFQYGGLDPLIERAGWEQPAEHVLRFDVALTARVWGWEAYYDASDALVVRIRRPPPIDVERPLAGKVIAVDAGHGGADTTTVGPTGLTEAAANLMIARRLVPMLEAAGARVVMIRPDERAVALGDRPRMARDSGAHALVSIHNNAFPDGVNPFVNSGTSVYYYHPHSADMARLFQRELLEELRLRDIGYGRADLALARPTWMPAVLTETMFMMVPQQEAALRDPSVQERIARAHLRALEAFFRSRAQ